MPYTLPNITNGTTGLEDLIAYEIQEIPLLSPALLIFILIIIFGAGYFAQERRTGKGNFPMWLAISSFITTTGATILHFGTGMVGLEIIVIFIITTIVSTLWFLTSDGYR